MKTWKTEKKKKITRASAFCKYLGNKWKDRNQFVKWLMAYHLIQGGYSNAINNTNSGHMQGHIHIIENRLYWAKNEFLLNEDNKWKILTPESIRTINSNKNYPYILDRFHYDIHKLLHGNFYTDTHSPVSSAKHTAKKKRNKENRRNKLKLRYQDKL